MGISSAHKLELNTNDQTLMLTVSISYHFQHTYIFVYSDKTSPMMRLQVTNPTFCSHPFSSLLLFSSIFQLPSLATHHSFCFPSHNFFASLFILPYASPVIWSFVGFGDLLLLWAILKADLLSLCNCVGMSTFILRSSRMIFIHSPSHSP